MTMENKPKRVAIVGRPRMPIAAAILAANSHCLDSSGSVSDEPIKYELSMTPYTEPNISAEKAVKSQRHFKKSRSKYSPVEEDRKHSQNIEGVDASQSASHPPSA